MSRKIYRPNSSIINRRVFTGSVAGLALTGSAAMAQEKDESKQEKQAATPKEAPFERDYDAPKFKPSWKNPQLNRTMVQDFVIYAHSDLEMVKKLYEREPKLLNGTMDWGNGDWECALGGASHMARKDIVKFLLSKGARMNLFCAAMLGKLDIVQSMLTVEPALIDAKGPHGFTLQFHAKRGGDDSKAVYDYLQSIKEDKPFKTPMKKGDAKKGDAKKEK